MSYKSIKNFVISCLLLTCSTFAESKYGAGTAEALYASLRLDGTGAVFASSVIGFGVGLSSIGHKEQVASAVIVDSIGFILVVGGGAWLAADSKYGAVPAGSLLGVGFITSFFSRVIQALNCGKYVSKYNDNLKRKLGLLDLVDISYDKNSMYCGVRFPF